MILSVTIPIEKISPGKLKAFQEKYPEVEVTRDHEDPKQVKTLTFELGSIESIDRVCQALDDLS